jgi:transcriptional pleiotropic regulator of transition state genes
MKEVGIARRVDNLGRIVLPAELRRLFGISPGDAVDISVDGDAIVLRKVDRACAFCDGVTDLRTYRERTVCANCAAGIAQVGGSAPGQAEGEVVHPPSR